MNNKIINIVSVFFLILLIFGCGKKDVPAPEQADVFFFKVQFILGDVKISGSAGEVSANPGDQVKATDTIKTGKNSVADLVFGTSGVIRIKENSKVTIASIADKTGSDTVIDMDNGKVLLTLSKLKGTGFKVKTPTAVAAVRGTSFTVISDKKGAKMSVVKGTVEVNPVKDGKIIEDKTVSVESGNTTPYIDKKAVDRIIMGDMVIPVMEMTPAEKIEIETAVKEIKIEEMPDLTLELKEEIRKETVAGPEVVEESKVEKKDEKKESSVKKDDKVSAAKKIAEEKRLAEERLKEEAELKKRQEEEAKRLAEEKKVKEEKIKKDRASNIPTM